MEWLYGHPARRKSPKLVWSVIRCSHLCECYFLFLVSFFILWWVVLGKIKKIKHTSTYFRTRWAAKATELNRHTTRKYAEVWWAKALFFPIRRRIKIKKKNVRTSGMSCVDSTQLPPQSTALARTCRSVPTIAIAWAVPSGGPRVNDSNPVSVCPLQIKSLFLPNHIVRHPELQSCGVRAVMLRRRDTNYRAKYRYYMWSQTAVKQSKPNSRNSSR